MSALPKISVITIVFNAVDVIEATIISVLNQRYPELEYIVIDGGSEDGTLKILEKYRGQIDILVSEPDEGISDAFNKGIRLASGQLIGLLNADDRYLPGALMAAAEAFRGKGVYYGRMEVLENGRPNGTYYPDHYQLEKDMTLCHPATFVAAETYEKYGLYRTDFRYAMDYELMLRFKTSGVDFYPVDYTFTAMSAGGVSDIHWRAAFDEVQRARQLLLSPGALDYYKTSIIKLRKQLGQVLEKGPLQPAVAAYRRWFSMVKKR